MSVILPPVIAIRSFFYKTYLNYLRDSDSDRLGLVRFTGENVTSSLAKFEVLTSNTGTGLVHIRCSHNKKFLRTVAEDNWHITALADEPEEDQSKWSCTLFQPRRVDGNPDHYRLFHVQLQRYPTAIYDGNSNTIVLLCQLLEPLSQGIFNPNHLKIMEIIDRETLMIHPPRHVAFKGHNEKFLGTILLNNQQYLAFDYTAKGRPETWFEVSTDGQGGVQILSHHTGMFWRYDGATNWILSDVAFGTNLTTDNEFWPVKIDNNTIALKSLSNNNFCSQVAFNDTKYCLKAAYSSIAPESRLVMEELVLSRKIYDTHFDLANAVIYGETPIVMATQNGKNDSDAENTTELKFIYTESKSSTWTTSQSWMLGMTVTVQFKIPFIGGTEVSATAEYTGSYEWGETITTETTLETTYSFVVLPRTSISVKLMATKGTCDVPYSYYQKDMLYNGQTVVYKKDDGLYTGINSYNFWFEVTTLTPGRSDTTLTVVQKIPNPLTESIVAKIPLPFLSTKAQLSEQTMEEITQDVAQTSEETTQEIQKLSLSPGV